MAKLNPVFSAIDVEGTYEDAASIKGVAGKTFLLLGIAVLSGFISVMYPQILLGNPITYVVIVLGAVISGFVGQLSVRSAKVCSIIYAICEGMMLGLVSFLFEAMVQGIILTAVLITATIFGVMLFLYSSNVLRATRGFVKFMTGVGVTILIISLVYFISSLINPTNALIVALENNPGLLLLISGLILLYGAFMLILDFEQVKSMVYGGFDKRYEWMASLGLMITIIWIYIEVLRIVAIFANRD